MKVNHYLTDIRAQLPILREVRGSFVNTAAPPASTTVEVSRLAADAALFEVEAIVALPRVEATEHAWRRNIGGYDVTRLFRLIGLLAILLVHLSPDAAFAKSKRILVFGDSNTWGSTPRMSETQRRGREVFPRRSATLGPLCLNPSSFDRPFASEKEGS
ncbi:hypothetical protein H1B27_00605 [Bradyrhizobium sp. CNPSo 4019]|uniref:Uncharacterized protein n=1 Tax=Bradyrhizobium diversitatis TaxID=2755406 RepID=A0ABS0NUU9_9BRAD|nr:hypothetical protein [Bradyrhizobium diversitatis]